MTLHEYTHEMMLILIYAIANEKKLTKLCIDMIVCV